MWPNPQDTADLVTFTEEILNGKRHVLRGSDRSKIRADRPTLLFPRYSSMSMKSAKFPSQLLMTKLDIMFRLYIMTK